MASGGRREGAGRKPTWNAGETQSIRVPVALAERVMAYARQLDTAPLESVTESIRPAVQLAAGQAVGQKLEAVRAQVERELARLAEDRKAKVRVQVLRELLATLDGPA